MFGRSTLDAMVESFNNIRNEYRTSEMNAWAEPFLGSVQSQIRSGHERDAYLWRQTSGYASVTNHDTFTLSTPSQADDLSLVPGEITCISPDSSVVISQVTRPLAPSVLQRLWERNRELGFAHVIRWLTTMYERGLMGEGYDIGLLTDIHNEVFAHHKTYSLPPDFLIPDPIGNSFILDFNQIDEPRWNPTYITSDADTSSAGQARRLQSSFFRNIFPNQDNADITTDDPDQDAPEQDVPHPILNPFFDIWENTTTTYEMERDDVEYRISEDPTPVPVQAAPSQAEYPSRILGGNVTEGQLNAVPDPSAVPDIEEHVEVMHMLSADQLVEFRCVVCSEYFTSSIANLVDDNDFVYVTCGDVCRDEYEQRNDE